MSAKNATTDAEQNGEQNYSDAAAEFVDRNHSTVSKAIRDGDADEMLDDVAAAEKDRDNGPRTKSVLVALSDRKLAVEEAEVEADEAVESDVETDDDVESDDETDDEAAEADEAGDDDESVEDEADDESDDAPLTVDDIDEMSADAEGISTGDQILLGIADGVRTNYGLCDHLGVTPSTIGKNVRAFVADGTLVRYRPGRKFVYFFPGEDAEQEFLAERKAEAEAAEADDEADESDDDDVEDEAAEADESDDDESDN